MKELHEPLIPNGSCSPAGENLRVSVDPFAGFDIQTHIDGASPRRGSGAGRSRLTTPSGSPLLHHQDTEIEASFHAALARRAARERQHPFSYFRQPSESLQRAADAVVAWPSNAWNRLKEEPKTAVLCLKAGIAATLAATLVLLPPPYNVFGQYGAWAVVTCDLVLESNVGQGLSKGVNRTLGTLFAGLLALLCLHVSSFASKALVPVLGNRARWVEAGMVLLLSFLGAAVPTWLKYRPPLKERWNYGVVMAMVTFHLLVVSSYVMSEDSKWAKPMLRFSMIVIGFLITAAINVGVAPQYAGSALHELCVKNLGVAADLLEHCVRDYSRGKVLRHVPDILSGRQADDGIHAAFHDIIMSDSEVDKHLSVVQYEPPHGRFVKNYPWELYDDITDNLRYMLYNIVALDSCLRGEIQAPQAVRDVFAEELQGISAGIARALQSLASSLRSFSWTDCNVELDAAEEMAAVLQHKISKHSRLFFSDTNHTPTLGPVSETSILAEPELESESVGAGERVGGAEEEPRGSGRSSGEDGVSRSRLSHPFPEPPPAPPPPPGGAVPRPPLRSVSLLRDWDHTREKIAALSLVKFASLLIEITAKMRFLIDVTHELAVKANFEGHGDYRDDASDTFP